MKDVKLNFIHLCDDAIFSQEGKLSLIGIFEVINLIVLPGSLLKAFLVFNMSILDKNLTKIDLDIVIKKADSDKEILTLPRLTPSLTRNNDEAEAKLGVTLQLANITFKEVGKYFIELCVNKEVIGKVDFEVKLVKKKGEVN